ncbi:hypothetical protein [Cellulomonas iranensis]|uniref:hypothetical protein n=1 Tax=Cellulomonas iranensis TaxID=76862 RepID=UPI0023F1A5D9|nr:hypothetical protein [Cellulomonas iranensis]
MSTDRPDAPTPRVVPPGGADVGPRSTPATAGTPVPGGSPDPAGARVPVAPPVPVDPPDPAELAATAALAVPGVTGLHPGPFGEIGTYLPGRRVAGVRVRTTPDGTSTEVHVVLRLGTDLRATAGAVHAAVRAAVGGDVHVVVDDLAP